MRNVALRFRSNGTLLPAAVTALSVAVFLLAGPAPAMAQQMTLPGKATVDPNGSAGYSIPISVPPGTAGQAPSLSFQYSNQSGNGLLGMGWSLGGLAAVSRCPQTIAQDGVMGRVNYDANDRFCLDGQRLFAINGGTYGDQGLVSYQRSIKVGVSAVVFKESIAPVEGDIVTWIEAQHAAQPRHESRPSSDMLNSWFDEMRKTFPPLAEADPEDQRGTDYTFYKNFIYMIFAGSVSEEGIVTAWKLAQRFGLRMAVDDELLPRVAPEGERHIHITALDGRKVPSLNAPNICIAVLDPAFAPSSATERWVLKQLDEGARGDASSATRASSLLRQWDDDFKALNLSDSVIETTYFQGFILLRSHPKDIDRIWRAALKLAKRLHLGLAFFENLP